MYACEVRQLFKNKKKLQAFQNYIVRIIVNASWFNTNEQLNYELTIPAIASFVEKPTDLPKIQESDIF